MDPISIISIFGPMISALIPQVGKLFGTGEVATRNQQTAQLVLDTVVKATNTPNVQAAVEAMQKDPSALQAATQAVITEPAIMGLLEIGGGVIAARQADHDATQGEKPFWFSPAFAITCLLVPLVYLVVSAVVFGLGGQWSDEMRSVVVTAIVTGLLGSISGYYLGSSLGSKSKDATIAQVKS